MAARSMDHTQWLAKLVAFDTTSRNSNLELIHYCKDYLEGLGVKCTLLHNAERNKANLWADAAGDGGVTKGGIILSGHTDVVPVDGRSGTAIRYADGAGWETVRSRHVRHEGLCCRVHVSGPRAPQDEAREADHFAWSYDEEVSCLGGMELAEFARDHDVRAEGCIIGEPTGMTVVIAHKGTSHFWVRVRGKAAHSSLALDGVKAATPSTTPQNSLRSCARLRRSTAGTAPGMTSRCRSQRCRRTSSVAATPRTPCPRSASSSSSFERFPTRLSPR
ncbi:putative glutamamyl carboxypeptidase [Trypanosoma cruzi]|uniref:Putative glutamamyl carboxypeptidase n=1 Tax=Trypanosoma cruzi TaxID=5693 RepID=A0A2V2V1F2_TRYCR|nr:putative glutamamyl carboxypeptidase [Trypanosoma cruzi]